MACPRGVIIDAGMMLPGNAVPVVGFMMGIRIPVDPTDLEKSPDLSSAVGSFTVCIVAGVLVRANSCVKKKKNLFLSLLNTFGM